MEKRTREILWKCRMLMKDYDFQKEYYDKNLDLIEKGKLDENLKVETLVQLYRYGHYKNVVVSIDPRGDRHFHFIILYNLNKKLENNELTSDDVKKLKEQIDCLQAHIDNPMEFIDKSIKFYEENPGVRF